MVRMLAPLLTIRPPPPAPRYEAVAAMPVRQFLLYAIAGICIGTVAVLCIRPFFVAVVVIAEALR